MFVVSAKLNKIPFFIILLFVITQYNVFKNYIFENVAASRRNQWVKRQMIVELGCNTFSYGYLIDAGWRMYASADCAIIGSDNGLSPIRRQVIIYTSDDILSIRH